MVLNRALSFCVVPLFLAASPAVPSTIHMSPTGDDTNPGTLDAPFATLTKARDATRAMRKAGELDEGPVIVNLHAGTYRITDTLNLTAEDSGTSGSPVIWQAAPSEELRLVGGVRITGWKPVSDDSVLMRLPAEARGHVLQADLKACGVTDFGTVQPGPKRAELFFRNRYMTLARYPNEGFLRIADVPEDAKHKRPISNPKRPELNRYEGPFLYSGDRPERWRSADDVWMRGYWFYDWSDQYHRVQRFNLTKKEVWPQPPYHSYGYRKNQRYYFLNLLEELDQPGEWYLDRDGGIVYFWPPEPIDSAAVMFPEFEKPMVVLDGVQHVSFHGITFECSRGGAVLIKGGEHNEVAGCTVRNVGGTAIAVAGGTHHVVRSCDVYEVAGTGVSVDGGDRKTLARGDHLVENCHIHHFAHVNKTYHPGIKLNGVGNRVSHCFLHDCPHAGIGYAGNDHVIEFSEFTRIAQETGDVGCTYTAFDWTYTGHDFRYNYFHHIHAPGHLGCFTIYPDLPCGGIHLYGNVFYDVDQVFHTNSGRGMLIENNLFVKCRRGLRFNVWGQMEKFRPGGSWQMVERLAKVDYDKPPYSTRYPMLAHLAEDFAKGDEHVLQRALPKDNVVRRNVSWGESFFLYVGPQANRDHVRVEKNVIADPVAFIGSPTGDGKATTYHNGDEATTAELSERGNALVQGNPGIADPQAEDFAFTPGSPASKLEFEPIPFDRIGLRLDAYRKSLPPRTPTPRPPP
jgi:hypothetical protein